MNSLFKVIWLLVLAMGSTHVMSQDDFTYREQDEAEWSETVDGEQYLEATQTPRQRDPLQIPEYTMRTGVLQVVGYTLIIVLLAVLIFFLLRSRIAGSRRVSSGEDVHVEDLDQRPMESDLDRLLREALQEENWRLAFRIQYLMVIRALNETGNIIWKREKTNHDYVRELGTHPMAEPLHAESLLFDRIWYGLRPLDQESYTTHSRVLQGILQKLEDDA